jgi:pyridoxine kinase
MPLVLCLSSQVARGHVGASMSEFVLQRLGVDVIALPTIILSSHAGHAGVKGFEVAESRIGEMLEAIDARGWLDEADAFLSGYMHTPGQAALAARWMKALKARRPHMIALVDPIIGDEPKGVYAKDETARAIRDRLTPLADVLTPNRFELGWLTGAPLRTQADAALAARRLSRRLVLVTSAPGENADELANLLISPDEMWRTTVPRRPAAPHGAGDFMASAFLGRILTGCAPAEALALATGAMDALLTLSEGADELRLVAEQERWVGAEPWLVEAVETTS